MEWPDAKFSELAAPQLASYDFTAAGRLCAGPGPTVLFGGWAMAAIADAAQSWSGLRLRSLSVSFLRAVTEGVDVRVTAEPLREGRRLTHALVRGRADGEAVLVASVTLGSPAGTASAWRPMPVVPPPGGCPERTYEAPVRSRLTQLLDVRLASREPQPDEDDGGSVLLWARVGGGLGPEAILAVLSDHVPYLVARTLPGVLGVSTVSSSLRVAGQPAGDWILLEIRLVAADADYLVGEVVLWDHRGAIVATAEQTVLTIRAVAPTIIVG